MPRCSARARGDNRPDIDIDIMIEIAPDVARDVYAYVSLKNYIADLFTGSVDVVDREALKSYVRASFGAPYMPPVSRLADGRGARACTAR
jgi:hypothetical protein